MSSSYLLKMFRLDRFYRDVIYGASPLNLQDRKNVAAVTWGFSGLPLTRWSPGDFRTQSVFGLRPSQSSVSSDLLISEWVLLLTQGLGEA